MMRLSKSQKRMFILLAVVAVYAVIDVMINYDKYKAIYFGSSEDAVQKTNKLVKNKIIAAVPEIDTLALHWKRDPFNDNKRSTSSASPQIEISKNPRQFTLQAITHAENNAMVMINNRILKSGESIDGYRINKIYKDKVELVKNNRTFFIKTNQESL